MTVRKSNALCRRFCCFVSSVNRKTPKLRHLSLDQWRCLNSKKKTIIRSYARIVPFFFFCLSNAGFVHFGSVKVNLRKYKFHLRQKVLYIYGSINSNRSPDDFSESRCEVSAGFTEVTITF